MWMMRARWTERKSMGRHDINIWRRSIDGGNYPDQSRPSVSSVNPETLMIHDGWSGSVIACWKDSWTGRILWVRTWIEPRWLTTQLNWSLHAFSADRDVAPIMPLGIRGRHGRKEGEQSLSQKFESLGAACESSLSWSSDVILLGQWNIMSLSRMMISIRIKKIRKLGENIPGHENHLKNVTRCDNWWEDDELREWDDELRMRYSQAKDVQPRVRER
jgi:hypothetical protein